MKIILLIICIFSFGCSSMDYKKTVDYVDIQKFMTKWYVIAGRLTFLEKGAHNATETYTWNSKEERIDIAFSFNKDSFEGEVKEIPQKGWIQNKETNAYWKVSPFWPLKFDYLIIDMDENYDWVVIGVPSQNYIWIMSKNWDMDQDQLEKIKQSIKSKKYNIENIKRVPQKW